MCKYFLNIYICVCVCLHIHINILRTHIYYVQTIILDAINWFDSTKLFTSPYQFMPLMQKIFRYVLIGKQANHLLICLWRVWCWWIWWVLCEQVWDWGDSRASEAAGERSELQRTRAERKRETVKDVGEKAHRSVQHTGESLSVSYCRSRRTWLIALT